MAEMVQISNPELPDAVPGTVSREAFDQIFKAKGFRVVDDNGDYIPDTTPAKAVTPKAEVAR